MKDVLEYTEEELNALSTAELKILAADAEDKESLFNTRQLVEKTLINSLYGALGNKYFSLFNEDMACAITGNGRFFIRKLANYIEDELQKLYPSDDKYLIGGDTDSVYLHIAPFMEKYQEKNPGLSMTEYVQWADSFEKKVIQPIIQKTIDDFSHELNAFNKDAIGCEREIIADKFYYMAKKKYFARVRVSEKTWYPEDSPKIKATGLEMIKSSTPIWSKKYLKDAIPRILDEGESDLRDWVNGIKNKFLEVSLNEIAATQGVSRIDYDLVKDKGVPIGSRGAITHNNYIKDNNLDSRYAPIQPGDKCKKLFLITPNKFNSNVILYTNEQFIEEIAGIIDYDTNFEKNFMNPLNLMVDALDYRLNRQTASLDEW